MPGLTSITIPNSVTSIGYRAFKGCTALTNITIPNSVTSIGSGAFYGTAWYNNQPDGVVYAGKVLYEYKGTMPSNTSITIKEGTLGIADRAFAFCSGLTSITIPNSVTSIGDEAFRECTRLTNITIPNSVTTIEDRIFADCAGLTSILVAEGNAVYDSRNNCNAIIETKTNTLIAGCKTTIIPNSVTSIGEYAFWCCETLTNIEIPYSVASIGNSAFYGCSRLTSVTIPNSVTSIGNFAFGYCTRLTSIVIPNSVTSIEQYTFYNCYSLASIEIPNSVTNIGEYAFYDCKGLTSITIPNSVTNIGDSAFGGCTGLTSITIPNSVTSIGDGAFRYCNGLTSIVIPNSVTSIGNGAFQSCISLNELHIEDGNNNLSLGYNATKSFLHEGEGLFYDCPLETLYLGRNLSYSCGGDYGYSPFYKTGLTNVTIGNKVTDIGQNLFYQCKTLKELRIEDGEKELAISPNINGSGWIGMFNHCPLEVIYLGRNLSYLTNASSPFYEITELTSVTVGSNVTKLESSMFHKCTGLKTVINLSNLTFTKGSTEYGYIAHYAEKVINAPNSTIDDNFIWSKNENENINTLACYIGDNPELTLPSSFNGEFYVIGDYAFYGCSFLTYINIADSITSIGEYAFYDCTGLERITIESGNTIYDSRENCNAIIETATNTLLVGCNNTTIPNGVASIESSAFSGCNGLKKVIIPNSVTNIGDYAFNGCTGLEELYISESIESIGDYAFADCNKLWEIKIGAKRAITANENIFTADAYNNVCLYVPEGRKFAYEKTTPWNKFYIVEMDFTGIEELKSENGKVKTIYDFQGRKVDTTNKGVYIINGKKVLIK